MADYATLNLPQSPRTSIKGNSGLKLDSDTAGNLRGRSLYSSAQYSIEVEHHLIDDTQKASLESFYNTNSGIVNSFTYDGDSTVYNVIFLSVPTFVWIAPNVWTARVSFRGHKV